MSSTFMKLWDECINSAIMKLDEERFYLYPPTKLLFSHHEAGRGMLLPLSPYKIVNKQLT